MKRSNRPVPIQVPQGDTAASFKVTDSGVWSEGGIILSTAGCIIDKGRLREDSQQRPAVVAECPQHAAAAAPQDDCSSSHIDQPVSEVSNCCTDAAHDGPSSASSSSRSHAGSSTGTQAHNSMPAGSASSSSNTSSPSSSTIVLSDLQELAVIGSGSSGVVKKVLHRPTQQVYVLKVINLDMGSQQVRRQVTREVRALDGARHPHVVSYHQSYFAEGAVTILMEFMDGGTLWDLLQKIRVVPEPYLAELTRQMLLGLSFLHDTARICHRDVKPSNLLLSSSGQLKISDFGTSSQLSNSMSKCLSWVGTVTYMSPERIRGDSYSFNTDVWSLGLLVLECALGRYPYPPLGTSEGGAAAAPAKLGFWELLEYIVVEPVPRLPAGQFSADLVDFMAQCLQKDAARRPSASQLLLHPFVAQTGSSKVNLADLLKLPRQQQQQQHGSSVNSGSTAGRNGAGLRRSGNYGGLRGAPLGTAPGGGLLRHSLSAAGKAGAASMQQQQQQGLRQGSIMGELPVRQAESPAAPAAANTALTNPAAQYGQYNSSSSSSSGASARQGTTALANPAQATDAAAAASGVAADAAGSPASPQPVATTSPPAPRAPGALTAAAASGALTPAMAAAAAAALRESSPLLSGQLMRQSAIGTLAGRPAGLAAAHVGGKASMLQQQHGLHRQPVQPERTRQSVMQQQQQAPRVLGLQQPQQQQQPQPCGPLQQQHHQQWLAGLAAQQVHQASLWPQAAGLHPHAARQQQQPPQQALQQNAQGPLAQQLAGMHLHQHHQQLQQQHSKGGSPNAATRAAGTLGLVADHKTAVGRMMTPDKQLGSTSSSGHGSCSPVVGQGPLTTLKPSTSRRLPDGPPA